MLKILWRRLGPYHPVGVKARVLKGWSTSAAS